jgi:hypothetical protein
VIEARTESESWEEIGWIGVDSGTVAFGAASVLERTSASSRIRVSGMGRRGDTRPSSSCKAHVRTAISPSRSCVAMTGRSK